MHRVVHITTVPQTAVSFLRGQLAFLSRHGFDVTLISSPGKQLEEFAESEGIDQEGIELLRSISPIRDVFSTAKLVRSLRRRRPILVHAHTPKAGLLGMTAATLAGVPIRVYHLHGLRFETASGLRRRILFQAEKTACRLAHRIYCVSPSVRAKAIDAGLFPANKSVVLANGSINGFDVDEYMAGIDRNATRSEIRRRLGIPESARCIGFVGRLVRDKGVEDLASAWCHLRVRYPDLHLLLVGPFETQDAVSPAARKQLEDDPRVHLTGADWNSRPYYTAMDVFTLPSHREGMSYVLFESAAMGLPVVSCRSTGCIDSVVDGVTGRLVDVQDPNALSDAIAGYLDDPVLRAHHGNAGRRRIRAEFKPLAIWQALLSEYQGLVNHGAIAAREDTAHSAIVGSQKSSDRAAA